MQLLSPDAVFAAQERISRHIHRTPVMFSSTLNRWLGHDIYFKMEPLQKIGAFKIRGALNAAIAAKEQGQLSSRIVAFSSGNHAQAVACAAKMLGVKATIFLPSFTSTIKQQAKSAYGAEVVLAPTRPEAEALTMEEVKRGATFIHPYDNDYVLAGQGTACLEALQDGVEPDAIFMPCGGGGLASGSWLAAQAAWPKAKVITCEPVTANDAAQSLREGRVIKLAATPNTIADGVTTLAVSERTFNYLRRLDGLVEVEEEPIIKWTQFLTHLLKVVVEPTSALAMAGAAQWLAGQSRRQRLLVILSAGNVAPETHVKIWSRNYLDELPGAV